MKKSTSKVQDTIKLKENIMTEIITGYKLSNRLGAT